MHAEISIRRNKIVEICRSRGVERLEIFGSAARGTDVDPERSDASFLVKFEAYRGPVSFFELLDLQNVLAAALAARLTRSSVRELDCICLGAGVSALCDFLGCRRWVMTRDGRGRLPLNGFE